MEKISVAFKNKKKANDLLDMLIFDKTSNHRGWYIKDNVPEEKRYELRALATYIPKYAVDLEKYSVDVEVAKEQPAPKREKNEHDLVIEYNWDKLLEERNLLKIALVIQEIGLPDDADIRTKILRVLSVRQEGSYPITYDGLVNACPSFAERYPMEYLENLLKSCITGARFYVEEIVSSNNTEEDKALMLFALPLGE